MMFCSLIPLRFLVALAPRCGLPSTLPIFYLTLYLEPKLCRAKFRGRESVACLSPLLTLYSMGLRMCNRSIVVSRVVSSHSCFLLLDCSVAGGTTSYPLRN
jgi:hypothetical protein